MRLTRHLWLQVLPALVLVAAFPSCRSQSERAERIVSKGRASYENRRCGECHDRVPDPSAAAPSAAHRIESRERIPPYLKYAGSRSPRGWIEAFLLENPSDEGLSTNEAAALSRYLETRRDTLVVPETEARALSFSDPGLSTQGRELYQTLGCAACHRIAGVGERVGPELTEAGRRLRPAYVVAILRDPQAVTPGSQMPTFGLTNEQVQLLATYLHSLGG